MKTDWSKLTPYSFPLRGMTKPKEICAIMKTLGIDKYIYEIRCNSTVKFGMSADSEKFHGARVYRQVGHLHSWGNSKLVGENGKEFLDIDAAFKRKYGSNIDHNDIIITVWVFDNYPWRTLNVRKELIEAESYLISQYEMIHQEKPVGNLFDESFWADKAAPIKSVYDNMFEET
jgi:hypothetical protein